MLGSKNNSPNAKSSALVARVPQLNTTCGSHNTFKKKNNRPQCDHCKRTRHTKESCWKIHGKLDDWKPSYCSSHDNSSNRGNVATTESRDSIEPSLFNKEQLETLQKMLQATVHSALNLVGTSTATMAQQGSIFTTLSANKTDTKPWIIDSGVSNHMTGDITTFDKYRSYNEGATV